MSLQILWASTTISWNKTDGVAVGGDYKNPEVQTGCVAVTRDGGETWRAPLGKQVTGFRACVAAGQDSGGQLLIAVGRNGSDFSLDAGENWHPLRTPRYNAIALAPKTKLAPEKTLAPATNLAWSVGPDGTITRWSIK